MGYELSVFGERHSISYMLEGALEELDTALLHGHAHGMPHMPFSRSMTFGNSARGVDVADLVRRTREPL